jgi:hypothetical protein
VKYGGILALGALLTTGAKADDLGLKNGNVTFETPQFTLRLVKDSQTVAGLIPKGMGGFDFTPSDRLEERAANRFYHLGDLNFRVRTAGEWRDYSTATQRKPVASVPSTKTSLTAADLSATLPADCPLKVTRRWQVTSDQLELIFDLSNPGQDDLEIGGFGIPMVFNNIITGRSLPEAHAKCAFSEPYIGMDAGYLQVTRLDGKGKVLVVTPIGQTPFEAYRPLDEPMRRNQTFEGMLEWTIYSLGYAEKEWKGAEQWNAPTSVVLKPGEKRTYGLRFLLADSVRDVEKTLAANRRPVAVGIPGFILPDDQRGRLFLKHSAKVKDISVEPSGAVSLDLNKEGKNGFIGYTALGHIRGRARVTITYEDSLRQTINYLVTNPARRQADNMGIFATTKQWFDDKNDPFGRAPSVISYDRDADKQVVQDSRVWIAGLGDEGGSSWLPLAMKISGLPTKDEVAQFDAFIDGVLWGNLQFKDGPDKYGVRKSVFYYDPAQAPGFEYDKTRDWRSWTSWSKAQTMDIGRAYNYPHVVAAYWAMYNVARNYPYYEPAHPWEWYLGQAYETTMFLTSVDERGRDRVGYMQLGLMGGTIFRQLLDDLKREGWTDKAALLEARMKTREARWAKEAYPFGSEMAWDSTGQEEVYAWCRYFGNEDKAQVSLNSILAYMSPIPHWGYNANARRYWDFLYGGKLTRIERQIHHYGSALNALPLLTEYRDHPTDYHLLRVGYGGMMAPLANIDIEGTVSAAFHSFPSTLKWDAYSGDYGPAFLGHALNTGSYLINHPDFGWQAFGGVVEHEDGWVIMTPKDTFRQRVFVAPAKLWLTMDGGRFSRVGINPKTGDVRAWAETSERNEYSLLTVGDSSFKPKKTLVQERGGYKIPRNHDYVLIDLVNQ